MEPLDLNKWYDWTKDDFYLTDRPKCHTLGWYRLLHFTLWTGNKTKNGWPGLFLAVHLFWYVRFYICNTKIDGTRTFGYWWGEYGDTPKPDENKFVANAGQPVKFGPRKEHWAFRLSKGKPDCEVWYNQGGL